MTDTDETTATVSAVPAAENGAVLFVPLNRLKKSPRKLRANPLGIYVNAINWSKELGQ